MIDYSNSPIKYDIDFILKNAINNHAKYVYEIEIHNEKTSFQPDLFVHYEKKRDYLDSIGDEICIIVRISASKYMKYINEFKSTLEVHMVKKLNSNNEIIQTYKYKAFIIRNTAEDNKELFETTNPKNLDRSLIVELELQLVDKDIYNLMDITTDGVYNNTKLYDVTFIKLKEAISKINYNEKNIMLNIDIVPFHNNTIYSEIVIPSGTKILGLPTKLQEDPKHGLYNSGVGTYIQTYKNNKYIYVYPHYSTERYKDTKYKLMIFRGRDNSIGIGEKTYCIDGNILKILPEFNYNLIDNGAKLLSKTNNEIVIGDMDKQLKNIDGLDEKELSIKEPNVKSYNEIKYKDGTRNPIYLGAMNNKYNVRAKQLKETTGIYSFKWNNSNIDNIYPAMPCKYIFTDNTGNLVELTGNVISTAEVYEPHNKLTTGIVNIMVNSYEIYKHNLLNKDMSK